MKILKLTAKDFTKPRPLKSLIRCSVEGHVKSIHGNYCLIDGWDIKEGEPLTKQGEDR